VPARRLARLRHALPPAREADGRAPAIGADSMHLMPIARAGRHGIANATGALRPRAQGEAVPRGASDCAHERDVTGAATGARIGGATRPNLTDA